MTVSLAAVLDEVGANRDKAHHRLQTASGDVRPWYVQTVVAAVIWVGALFFASYMAAMRVFDSPGLALTLGVSLFVAGGIGARLGSRLLRLHIALVCYAGCTSLLIGFADSGVSLSKAQEIVVAAIVQLSCLVWFDSRPVRFKAIVGFWLAALAFAMMHREWAGMDVLLVALAATTTLWWTEEARLLASPLSRAVRPVGFGLVVVALGISWLTLLSWRDTALSHPLVVSGALAALLLFVVLRAAREVGAGLKTGAVIVALLGVLVAASLASQMPAVLLAGLVIVLGRLRREVLLEGLGALALGVSLLWVYYNLELSLLYTSFALAGAGVLAFAARAFLLRGTVARAVLKTDASVLSPVGITAQPTSRLVLVPMLVVVALVVGLVGQKEQVLKDGQTVLLPLMPADPRSLLQGDYMQLRYEHAAAVQWHTEREGTVWAQINDDNVVTSVVPTDAPEAVGGVLLKWHRVRGQVAFGANSFFFAEGAAERMALARFVEVRVASDGTPVLVQLRDANRAALVP